MACFSPNNTCVNSRVCNASDGCMYAIHPEGPKARAYRDALVRWFESGDAERAWRTSAQLDMFQFLAGALKYNEVAPAPPRKGPICPECGSDLRRDA